MSSSRPPSPINIISNQQHIGIQTEEERANLNDLLRNRRHHRAVNTVRQIATERFAERISDEFGVEDTADSPSKQEKSAENPFDDSSSEEDTPANPARQSVQPLTNTFDGSHDDPPLEDNIKSIPANATTTTMEHTSQNDASHVAASGQQARPPAFTSTGSVTDHGTHPTPVKKKTVLFSVDEHAVSSASTHEPLKVEIPEHALSGSTATKPLATGFAHEMGIPDVGRGSKHAIADVHAPNETYYSQEANAARASHKTRAMSTYVTSTSGFMAADVIPRERRFSLDNPGNTQYILNVERTLERLLAREDTDNNHQITIEDDGPKVLSVGTARSDGYKSAEIRGTYKLSSLLQELTIAKDMGRKEIILDSGRLSEDPVKRLSRFIETMFWDNLTRRIDGGNIEVVAKDSKDWTGDPRPRIYVPLGAPEQYEYYSNIAKKHPQMRLDVCWLQKELTGEYIRDLKPGLLAVGMDETTDEHGEKTLQGKPFIVPGGRFNEFYGWDSYMATLGLLVHNRVDICKSMVENFIFCIKHYGKIFNANRSYYLGRSQPPFLTDMLLRVYQDLPPNDPATKEFLRQGTLAAIKEYYNVWMGDPRLDKVSGLSRYRPFGLGVPPETEASHFDHVLEPYAEKHGLSKKDFIKAYNMQEIKEPELDEYFLHDRAVRESGHDTSYRLEKVAADLATVDLNSCLYKIEVDITRILKAQYNNAISIPDEFLVKYMKHGHVETSASWERRAKRRRIAMDRYMWNEEKGMYFDYNTKTKQQSTYESATTFWAMWSGLATPRQAASMVISALPRFEMYGGLVSGTEASRGKIGLDRPSRQWDFPFGWAPHQILAWHGFDRYGFREEAQRLAYRWCHMVTKAFVDFNGIVVEKYDLTRIHDPQRVEAEYGNQGSDFKGVPKEGFGWVNASYIVGLDLMTADQLMALGTLVDWETFSGATANRDLYGLEVDKLHTGWHEQAVAEHGVDHGDEYAQPHHHAGHEKKMKSLPLAEQEHEHGPEIPVHNEKEDKLARLAGPHGNGSYMSVTIEKLPSQSENTHESSRRNSQ